MTLVRSKICGTIPPIPNRHDKLAFLFALGEPSLSGQRCPPLFAARWFGGPSDITDLKLSKPTAPHKATAMHATMSGFDRFAGLQVNYHGVTTEPTRTFESCSPHPACAKRKNRSDKGE